MANMIDPNAPETGGPDQSAGTMTSLDQAAGGGTETITQIGVTR